MADRTWDFAEAEAKFDEVIEQALIEGPQQVTQNGKDPVVVVSAAEWARLTNRPRTAHEFLERSPPKDMEIDVDREPDPGRDVFLD